MKIEPGIYKVKERGHFGKHHLLIVKLYNNGKRFYQIDGGVILELEDEVLLEQFKSLKPIRQPICAKQVKLTLEWEDNDGDEFEVNMRDIQLLRRLFEEYPELARAFGSRKV